MNYYGFSDKKTKYKGKKKRFWFNTLIIVVVITLAVVFALILGNDLKRKLDESNVSTDPLPEITTETPTAPNEDKFSLKTERTYGELAAVEGYLDLEGCSSTADAAAFVRNLSAAGYNGIYFEMRDAEGYLTFASPAASEITKTRAPSSVISYEILSSAFTAARSAGMRITLHIDAAVLLSSEPTETVAKQVNDAVFAELYGMGANELIFSGLVEGESFDSDLASVLFERVSEIRAICPDARIGIVLDPKIFEDHELTPTLEMIFRFSDFFAVDLRDASIWTPTATADMLERLSGSFSAYCIRILSSGRNVSEIRERYAVSANAEKLNISFAVPNAEIPEAIRNEDGELLYSSKIFNYSLTGSQDET